MRAPGQQSDDAIEQARNVAYLRDLNEPLAKGIEFGLIICPKNHKINLLEAGLARQRHFVAGHDEKLQNTEIPSLPNSPYNRIPPALAERFSSFVLQTAPWAELAIKRRFDPTRSKGRLCRSIPPRWMARFLPLRL